MRTRTHCSHDVVDLRTFQCCHLAILTKLATCPPDANATLIHARFDVDIDARTRVHRTDKHTQTPSCRTTACARRRMAARGDNTRTRKRSEAVWFHW